MTVEDIILNDEFSKILGKNFINTITNEEAPDYDHRMINEAFLKDNIQDFNQHFYICGPDPMVHGVQQALKKLGGAESVIVVEM